MRVKLLNDGGFDSLKDVAFPLIVEGCYKHRQGRGVLVCVPIRSVLSEPADRDALEGDVGSDSYFLYSTTGPTECVILTEENSNG